MVFISMNVCLMVVYGSLNFVSRSFIEGACVVPLAHVVMMQVATSYVSRERGTLAQRANVNEEFVGGSAILCIYEANIFACFAERAKEKIKSVVNMYGINSVQTLMAQMYVLHSPHLSFYLFLVKLSLWFLVMTCVHYYTRYIHFYLLLTQINYHVITKLNIVISVETLSVAHTDFLVEVELTWV